MNVGLKIRQLIFGEQLILVVQRTEDSEYFCCSAFELFRNDELLVEFSLSDVRLISYFAAVEEYKVDQKFLQKFAQNR